MKARLIHLFIVWFAVYVTVTLSLLALRRLAPGMPLWANTLMLTMIRAGKTLEEIMAAGITSGWDKQRGNPAMFINRSYVSLTTRYLR